MGELAIRRNRGLTTPRYQAVEKTEKAAGSAQTRSVGRTAGCTVSETLQQLLSRVRQAEDRTRESRRTLQAGEAVLAEVKESLSRLAEMAEKAAGGGEAGHAALQAELERLCEEIDRMTGSAVAGDVRLFLDEGGLEDGAEALLYAALEVESSEPADGVQALPSWLTEGIAREVLSPEQLLAALGLDKSAGSEALLAALAGRPLEGGSAAATLAALYLGAVISSPGAAFSGEVDPQAALEGLQKLLYAVEDGAAPDEALEMLTKGAFASFSEFESQFTGGSAPGLADFLTGLLLTDGGVPLLAGPSLLALLAETGEMNLELLMGLLDAMQGSAAQSGAAPQEQAAQDTAGAAEPPVELEADGTLDAARSAPVADLGKAQGDGEAFSGVSFDAARGELTISGTEDVTVQGAEQNQTAIRLTGSGTVILRNVRASELIVDTSAARVFSAGESLVDEISLREGASLTFLGGGLVKAGTFRGGASNTLYLSGGAAVQVEGNGGAPGRLPVPVILDGPASLAAQAAHVTSPAGKALEPFDVIWRTLLPGWSGMTSLELDGQQVKLALNRGDPIRLWLAKEDPSHGSPVHAVVIRGRDEAGRPKTRYAYLHWNQYTGAFEETVLYPNPFTVTGGEAERDWVYEEGTRTLYILTAQVTAVSGGSGVDANQVPFSGRIVLADGIGALELTLGGVTCRTEEGRAFHLGRENDVALLLQSGTSNHFASGAGCAGISLGEGTSLRIDCPDARAGSRNPAGSLTASGGDGGAGIGRDGGGSRDQTSRIVIRGGTVTASGTGGGAGIGAGKHSAMGPVTILGGTVDASGGPGGGAGIGGALGAPVGDIHIRGGKITAAAASHAAAIGAGVQGACGDILITGTARIVKAQGGNPGADIGACLFGSCRNVRISGAADIGSAGLQTRTGVSLQMGEEAVTLPQFRLSARALQLDKLSVATRKDALATARVLDAGLRWIGQIQDAYGAFYARLEHSFRGLSSVQQYLGGADPVRDAGTADTLLRDVRRTLPLSSSQAVYTHQKRNAADVRQLLR